PCRPVARLCITLPSDRRVQKNLTTTYYTTGHYSIFIKVMCKSIDALQQVLINKIQTIDEIQSTETLIVLQNPIMRTIKP
ncbi:Lrp/AsnC ligand binding domain-containing protein, partial [Klebsiella pneumoniae]|uniref:Lrp/AsnC ligand binding domain-containing protein n=1 Tax=Klebsiella pneumoniae TaxID=573 RepID=UPI002162AFBD